jgi:hypothetical protein
MKKALVILAVCAAVVSGCGGKKGIPFDYRTLPSDWSVLTQTGAGFALYDEADKFTIKGDTLTRWFVFFGEKAQYKILSAYQNHTGDTIRINTNSLYTDFDEDGYFDFVWIDREKGIAELRESGSRDDDVIFVADEHLSEYPTICRPLEDHNLIREMTGMEPVAKVETAIPQFEWSHAGIVDMGSGIRILLPTGGWAVSPETFEPMLSEQWRELIYNSVTERHELKTANLSLERGYNECWEDSIVHVASERKAMLLIHGLAPQGEEVPTVDFRKNRIWPDETMSFELYGRRYVLRGEGIIERENTIRTDTGEERWDEVRNYKLFLATEGSPESTDPPEQTIVAMPSFNDQFVTIRWIGDLDGDQKPDMLLDISQHYEEEVVVLYLSSKAAEGELVGAAAVSCYSFSC